MAFSLTTSTQGDFETLGIQEDLTVKAQLNSFILPKNRLYYDTYLKFQFSIFFFINHAPRSQIHGIMIT